ncbi:Acidic leucine-rich nuclear phosphoprotein 32 family member A [Eumeta japonica]|uniref:Acidic leucine-rich nuclear phosphoprotein 32 family member A n=1 Tax=Eumeta variegata TaxID=151549 RepID=A0A4C1YZA7_EUMVA|nr:Acidic leucine-rich nuclear phosphoprotein 32 family member A [Eumeta japonica]
MEKRVLLELRGKTPSQIKDLNLDNCRSTTIVGLTDEYINLETLSLNNVGLTTLKGFPTLPKLRKLELSDNRISNGLNFLTGCKKLTLLNLSNNKIKDLEALTPLKEFEYLKNLDLFNNEVTTIEDYRNKVFALNPSLKYLDGFDKEDREADETSDDGEEEMNGNNDSDEDKLHNMALDMEGLKIDTRVSERSPEERPSLPVLLYTVYGLIFYMGYLLKSSDLEEEEEEGSGNEDVSLSAVYNDNLEEESSDSSLYVDSDVEEEEDEDEEGDDDEGANASKTNSRANDADTDAQPEESTRGKKRKHEDDEN